MTIRGLNVARRGFRCSLIALLFIPLIAAPGAHALFDENTLPSVADLADEVKHSVVNISTTKVVEGHPLQPFFHPDNPFFREFFGDDFMKKFFGEEQPQQRQERKTYSLGSGIIIDDQGHILTNNHVIEKADEIKILLENEKEYDAKIVGRDPKTDLALIKVEPDKDFPKPIELGDSDVMRVGDWVMAIGNPYGLSHTVTVGIISAKGRIIGAGPYDDFLQTDAAINPGNSGGPLFNMKGEVVGVNTAIIAQGQNIGFSIPINMAKALLPQLKKGKVVRGWLGIAIQDVTPELAKSFDLEETKGVLVSEVMEDSPAKKHGLEQGDVIIAMDDKKVETARQLSAMVAATAPETEVELKVVRDGKHKTVKIELGTMPSDGEMMASRETSEDEWGLAVQNLTPEIARRFNWDEDEQGVIVTDVEPGSPADEGEIRQGDLIKEVNRKKIQNVRDYNQVIRKAPKDEPLLLLVKRGRRSLYVPLSPIK